MASRLKAARRPLTFEEGGREMFLGCSGQPGGPMPKHHHPGHHHGHGFTDPVAMQAKLEAPEREAWQRPEAILEALQLTGAKEVAEVGAGSGYFALRLAKGWPELEVLATELSPAVVAHLGQRALAEGCPRLKPIQAGPDDLGLGPQSVDRILHVHVWHHVEDREAHAQALAKALRPGGLLCLVDFHPEAPMGPPPTMRVPPEAAIATLKQAGLQAVLLPLDLPGQYLIRAAKAQLEP